MDDPLLTLRPITESDETAALHILKNPDLSRTLAGLREVETSDGLVVGVCVRLDRQLFGYVELLHNDDDGHAWELSVVFADHKASRRRSECDRRHLHAFEALSAIWFGSGSNALTSSFMPLPNRPASSE